MQRYRLAVLLSLMLWMPAALHAAGVQYAVKLDPLAAADGADKIAAQLAATYGGTVVSGSASSGTFVLRIPETRARLLASDPHVSSLTPVPNAAPAVQEVVYWTGGVSYTYDGSGNIRQAGNDKFAYDYAGRLVQADVNGISRKYDYDAYGNRKACSQPGTDCQYGLTISATNNRIEQAGYDGGGNVKTFGGHAYTYDALHMPVRDDHGPLAREYVYTADDERLAVYEVGSSWHWTVRGIGASVLREFSSSGAQGTSSWKWERDYVYRGPSLLASRQPAGQSTSTYHYHLDHLGTPRRVTDDHDATVGFHDYYAFGPDAGGLNEPSAAPLRYTGHERDSASDLFGTLDYMHARYYSPIAGRFLSVDPGRKWNPKKPQTWNLYAYVRNNPLNFTDPTGRYECQATKQQCTAFENARQANLQSKRASQRVKDASATYGSPTDKNGIVVKFGATSDGKGAEAKLSLDPSVNTAKDGTTTASVKVVGTVTVNPAVKGTELQAAVAHEGSHISDAQKFASSFDAQGTHWNDSLNLTGRQTEVNAYAITADVANLTNSTFKFDGGTFTPLMLPIQVQNVTDEILRTTYTADYLANTVLGWNMKSPSP